MIPIKIKFLVLSALKSLRFRFVIVYERFFLIFVNRFKHDLNIRTAGKIC